MQHTNAQLVGELTESLCRAGPLPARQAIHGDRIEPGRIYLAPAGLHLWLENGQTWLRRSPKENHNRPAIDPLFRSAALAYEDRVVGALLTGFLGDGTAGLWEIKIRGGVTVVQDPEEASYPDMPRRALECVEVDHCLSLVEIGSLLVGLAGRTSTNAPVYPPPGAACITGTPKVLIIEANRLLSLNLAKDLVGLGYHVVACLRSGEQAIEVMKRLQPDLVIMDVVLAGDMSGLEAARAIRQQFHTPVVYLTARADNWTIERAKVADPYGYVVKPTTIEQLHAVLQLALSRRERERVTPLSNVA